MSLYVLGGVVMDTRPFNADTFDRTASADLVQKAVMGGMQPSEFMGEGEDALTITGQLLPFKTGGLEEFDVLDEMRRTGARFPVMRGDGKRLGTYAVTALSERHKELMRNGVGFTVQYSVSLRKVQSGYDGGALIAALISIFESLR
jgi:phage protein U